MEPLAHSRQLISRKVVYGASPPTAFPLKFQIPVCSLPSPFTLQPQPLIFTWNPLPTACRLPNTATPPSNLLTFLLTHLPVSDAESPGTFVLLSLFLSFHPRTPDLGSLLSSLLPQHLPGRRRCRWHHYK